MASEKYEVIITPQAKIKLREIVEYVEKRSSTNTAEKVRSKLIQRIKDLDTFPRRFSREYYLEARLGEIRSLTQWSYKIIYEIKVNQAIVLSTFHTSRDPSSMG